MSQNVEFQYRESAFSQRLVTFAIKNFKYADIREFLNEAYLHFEIELLDVLTNRESVKMNTIFFATFEKIIAANLPGENDHNDVNLAEPKKEKQDLYIHTNSTIILRDENLHELYEKTVVKTVLRKIDDAVMQGSGFTLLSINELVVEINQYDPLRGSSYIELPKYLANKHAIINVKNRDDKCFMWAVLAALHPAPRDGDRLTKYIQYQNELNFTGIKFPMQVQSIEKFERLNETISINVYMYDSSVQKILPLRLTKNRKGNHIHLMLLSQPAQNVDSIPKQHYCWIKDLSKLLSSQVSKHKKRAFFCDRCLNYFWKAEKLEQHIIYCASQNECQIEMPILGNGIMEFKNYKNQVKCPFIIYADVEALLKQPTENQLFGKATVALQQHETYSVGYYLKCSYDDSKSYYKAKRGPDCLDWFANELHSISNELLSIFESIIPLKMSPQDEEIYLRTSKCHICEKQFIRHAEIIVRDHCHFTGEFRGPAHQECNLQYRNYRTVPVVFHNLTHYDAHFIIEKIASGFDGSVKIIPINAEKYISFIKVIPNQSGKYKEMIKLKFIDSFRFMAYSLDKLASFIPSNKKAILLRNEFKDMSDEKIHLLERKGVFCYDYVDSWEKLEETSLPPIEAFYSKLTNEQISNSEYEFAQNIWEKFNIKTLGDYADLYLRVDVCLLTIVFENFRETSLNLYKLDPANYFTAPGLSFDALLKYTKVKLELLTDIDMLLFIERGIRGGISQCSKRYMKANNKYMTTYDENQKSTFIQYEDCNNLYGFVMMQHLPTGGFQWVENHQFTADEILSMPDDAPIGHYFEVDLDYPESLHDSHNDYPFCAENSYVPNKKNVKKLLLTFLDKKKYIIHYRMLKLALQHGLILKKIHRTLKFKQSTWMKPYIELNTSMRTKAANKFEKEYYKLMNNSVFGKCMENVRHRIDIFLRTTWEGCHGVRKLVAMPNFKRRTIFNENLVAVEMQKTNILMDKPIPVGMAILDISKVVMYEYYYNFLKKKYGKKIQLAYTDTDSFLFQVETDDYYEDMKANLERYDTSEFPEDNVYQMPRCNKKVPGLFKDELNGTIITEFVGLRSKMYSVRTNQIDETQEVSERDGKDKKNEIKKAKGLKKYVLKKEIEFNDYKNCLENHEAIKKNQLTFRSKLHKMYTIQQEKVALSPFDDKRHIVTCVECESGACATCNFGTLAHGHYKLKRQSENGGGTSNDVDVACTASKRLRVDVNGS